jgi:hypothetical protein
MQAPFVYIITYLPQMNADEHKITLNNYNPFKNIAILSAAPWFWWHRFLTCALFPHSLERLCYQKTGFLVAQVSNLCGAP